MATDSFGIDESMIMTGLCGSRYVRSAQRPGVSTTLPVEGLFLSGAGTQPTGGISGVPGHARRSVRDRPRR